ncbi:sigma factor-like helix-turn-helix DNA-binding protein [Parasphingorhabdus pacifica]
MDEREDEPEEVLRADKELYDRLRSVGCSGPWWNLLANELDRYAWSAMTAWLNTGLIAQKCHEKGRHVTLPDDWTYQDREDLVATTVAHGLALFQRALQADLWKPEKGASLRTYFVGGCVLAFPNVLRQWRNERQRYRDGAAAYAQESAVHPPRVDPFDIVDTLDALKDLTRDENGRNQAILNLCYDGYSPAEIANVLRMTPGAVNTTLHRLRRRRRDSEGREG